MNYAQYKKIIDIDKNPVFITYVQTIFGKVCLLLVLIILLTIDDYAKLLIATVGLVTFFPSYRRLWLLLGALTLAYSGVLFALWDDWHHLISRYDYHNVHTLEFVTLSLFFLVSVTINYLTARFKHIPWLQQHVLNLSVIILGMILLVEYGGFSSMVNLYLWAFIIFFGHNLWYMAYTMHDIKILHGADFIYEYKRYHPIWGGVYLPYPKGPAYLSHIEAKTSEDFAVTQLKGIKLLWWACLLHIVWQYSISINNHIPTLARGLVDYEHGIHYSQALAWKCLLLNFVNKLLKVTVDGHFVIGLCRLCGYRALRNTYKPLLATTLAEFWNRYFFYFKELLVDFFFYPTFFRFFKTQPKCRIFFATLAAATFGNMLWHGFLYLDTVREIGIINTIKLYYVYMFYTVILGVSIGCSQLRNLNKPKTNPSIARKCLSITFVLSFYILLSIFSQDGLSNSILANFKFLATLFHFTW